MERKVGLRRVIQAVGEIFQPVPLGEMRIRDAMEAHNVTNSKDLPRSIRASLAIQTFIYYEFAKGEKYAGGDVPTLGLWFAVASKLGPDALVDSIKADMVDRRMLEAELRGLEGLNKEERLQRRIDELEQMAIKEGWKQDPQKEVK